MTYGLEAYGNDGSGEHLLIDSSLNTTNYAVVGKGTGTSCSVGGSGTNEILLINYTPPSNTPVLIMAVGSNGSYNFGVPNTGATMTPISVNWMLARDMTDVTPSGDYGLLVYNDSGAVAFDSRRYTTNSSFHVSGYQAARGLNALGPVITGSDAFDYWFEMQWGFYYWQANDNYIHTGLRWEKDTNPSNNTVVYIDVTGDEFGPLFYPNYDGIMYATAYGV